MPRGKTLGELVLMLREEVGDATSAALGQNTLPGYKRTLRRTQEFLWGDWAWPHLRVYREEVMQAGQRYYTLPADLAFDRVENVHVRDNDIWRPVCYGIELEHYNASDPELGDRDDPVERWKAHEDGQFEVWPVPATNGLRLRFEGIRKLASLVDDADRADLDDNLIVMFAAAEILGRKKSADGQAKAQVAGRLYRQLKGHQSKDTVIVIGGGRDPNMGPKYHRPYPRYGRKI